MLHGNSQMICTICQEPLGENAAGIFGVETNGTLSFGWSCCHHPVGDVAVFFGSKVCCEMWLQEHPEYRATISELIENHGKAKNANADT